MRGICIILLAALTSGCVAQQKPQTASTSPVALASVRTYQPSSSGSLAFDPPVAIGQPPLALSREGRSADAFVGYESITATYFNLRTDDRQIKDGDGRFDRYDRRAIFTKVGVSYR